MDHEPRIAAGHSFLTDRGGDSTCLFDRPSLQSSRRIPDCLEELIDRLRVGAQQR